MGRLVLDKVPFRAAQPLGNMISIKQSFLFGAIAVSLVSLGRSSHRDYKGDELYDSHPQYKFEYSVHDPHTHDIKSQEESRDGDHVKGYYMLKESDGSVREVHYTADKRSGFNAEVTKDGLPLFEGIGILSLSTTVLPTAFRKARLAITASTKPPALRTRTASTTISTRSSYTTTIN